MATDSVIVGREYKERDATLSATVDPYLLGNGDWRHTSSPPPPLPVFELIFSNKSSSIPDIAEGISNPTSVANWIS